MSDPFRISSVNPTTGESPLDAVTNETSQAPAAPTSDGISGVVDSIVQDTSNDFLTTPTNPDPFASDMDAETAASYISNELTKSSPNTLDILNTLMGLTPQQDVQVVHDLRTNGDIYKLLDHMFADPNVAPQMGQFLDRLKSVLPDFPGIQDIVDEIQKRIVSADSLSSRSAAFSPLSAASAKAMSAPDPFGAVDDAIDMGGAVGSAGDGNSFSFGWPTVGGDDPYASQRNIDSSVNFVQSQLSSERPWAEGIFENLMGLSGQELVQVFHQLRTNGDIYKMLDVLFANPEVARKMGQVLDKLQAQLSNFPGMQDIADDIAARLAKVPTGTIYSLFDSQASVLRAYDSAPAPPAPSDDVVDYGGAVGQPDNSGFSFGWPTGTDPFSDVEQVDAAYNYIENQLSSSSPDNADMFQKLMDLSPAQDVQVVHDLRTNGDIYKLLNSFFADPNVAPKMQEFLDKLKSVLSTYPGIQDIVDEIQSRIG